MSYENLETEKRNQRLLSMTFQCNNFTINRGTINYMKHTKINN